MKASELFDNSGAGNLMNYSKLTNREIDFEIAKALGCEWHSDYLPVEKCGCEDGRHGTVMRNIKPYSTSWEHAGPLLETLPLSAISVNNNMTWTCTIHLGFYAETSLTPQRAICEAFLKWRDTVLEGLCKNSRSGELVIFLNETTKRFLGFYHPLRGFVVRTKI